MNDVHVNPAIPVQPEVLASKVQEGYFNQSLLSINDHEIRMSVMTQAFGWHRHPTSDEAFLVLEGKLVIEFRDREVLLEPGQMLTVPAGTLHRTRPVGPRSVNLTFERAGAETIFEDSAP